MHFYSQTDMFTRMDHIGTLEWIHVKVFYLSFGYRDSYEGGFDSELEFGLVASTGGLELSVVPGFGMILNGPIFFKTSDLNSIVS